MCVFCVLGERAKRKAALQETLFNVSFVFYRLKKDFGEIDICKSPGIVALYAVIGGDMKSRMKAPYHLYISLDHVLKLERRGEKVSLLVLVLLLLLMVLDST